MSVEEVGITSTSFFLSRDTRALGTHPINDSTKTAAFLRQRMDSFWDAMILLQMNPNRYLAVFRSFFSINIPTSIHLGVPSNKRGVNHFFISSSEVVLIIL
ncbi:hypothetical protein H5410_004990 [Solanum commersonii]|uniref:Uncharacterized protein n=1 Tax=Solanum commersonii TaxID=4109 RepID=A0A9J6A6D9_SOLCO|nr:hypothetical protein H5410_004990 [Solanum commersonii]